MQRILPFLHYPNMERRYFAENEAIGVMLSLPKPLAMVQSMALPRKPSNPKLRNKFRGCLLGGGVGDALGAPVEFLHLEEIEQVYGKQGIRDYAPAYGKIGAITDDTQMTLFTAEAMLAAEVDSTQVRSGLDFFRAGSDSYQRWLATQEHAGRPGGPREMSSWLFSQRRLFARRSPGTTCLSSLEALRGKSGRASNDSKGCGAVMRSAPVGMYFAHQLRNQSSRLAAITKTFETARDLASITHGHPTGSLTAGVFAVVVGMLLVDEPLAEAIDAAKGELHKHIFYKETLYAIERAEKLAKSCPRERDALRELGKAFVAEEALAISLYCALCSEDFAEGILLAVNHSGDSSATGSMTGNLLGATCGLEGIPEKWLKPLELRDVIEAVADDLAAYPEWRLTGAEDAAEREFYRKRYPI
jgi:ADP-ribosylglycohydrolase